MNYDDIIIRKASVHILDSLVGLPVLAENELDCGPDLYDFFRKHIEKISQSSNIKKTIFSKESEVKNLLFPYKGDEFVQIGRQLALSLYGIMNGNIEIPPADLVVLEFREHEQNYLGLLKMNYQERYTHEVEGDETGIVRDKTLLPRDSQVLTEAAVINLDTGEVYILEKRYSINGQKANYFSSLFLQCEPKRSIKEKIKGLNRTIEHIGQKFFAPEDVTRRLKIKGSICQQLVETGVINVDELKDTVCEDNESAKAEFEERIEKYEITDDVLEINSAEERKFAYAKIKCDTGIEIKLPMECYSTGLIKIVENEDGTQNIILQDISNISCV